MTADSPNLRLSLVVWFHGGRTVRMPRFQGVRSSLPAQPRPARRGTLVEALGKTSCTEASRGRRAPAAAAVFGESGTTGSSGQTTVARHGADDPED